MRNIVFPLILAVGMLVLGLCIRSGFSSLSTKNRFVDVRGLAERTVKANQVTWPVQYTITGDDLPALYQQCTDKNKIVLDFLTSNGIPASEISVNPPNIDDISANAWNDKARFKYSLTSTMTVLTTQVDKVRELLNRQGELLNQGIAFANLSINYTYTDLNKIKPEMIVEATKNAREAAEQFAKDSESVLGKIKTATQGYFSIEDTDPSTPYVKNIRVVTNVTYYLED
ncbi:MAG: SIMPL domain-containing protein [Bacteroidales bacterium]|nr:SIMPL domain-containing protein [Bacteroidales bacterium]